MALNNTCIFCKIIKGEIPSAKVYENEHVVAFLDISQATKGHTLVIPKTHKQDIFELTPDIASNLFACVPKIANAMKKQFNIEGVNLLNNSGKVAGQTVFHYHLHILPRYGKEDGFHPTLQENNAQYTPSDLQEIAAHIAAGIES
ncbi:MULTISPECIES: HIT family protein [Aneurinibacillus]|uniref:HIT family protein n=1 Tax=Aneurinibacillus thermoaerophilus TaxID=143495 RepID=A0A1G7XPR9_ANETH|nr:MULTISPECIES: HIT family protein [Aneurinibacillus]AMA73656.1 protein hit [Aneurinibacillus sp. XH2]MED0675058.1 HIT family protein [Aneurinibacillus thermoaerophilus]MED0679541.1 HIT family protein [Aneurinibacillus thermoaerophilus]MED0737459.1 HIT family protein [Aneurinibacillus thermoaerophilus]MED0756310.1 HIT family protein [Aneurinibacillus thermoaerophilus]